MYLLAYIIPHAFVLPHRRDTSDDLGSIIRTLGQAQTNIVFFRSSYQLQRSLHYHHVDPRILVLTQIAENLISPIVESLRYGVVGKLNAGDDMRLDLWQSWLAKYSYRKLC